MYRNKPVEKLIGSKKYKENIKRIFKHHKKDFKKDKKKYGFYGFETWSLNHYLMEYIYSRCVMYRDKASDVVDLQYNKFVYGNQEITQLQAINMIIYYSGKVLQLEEEDFLNAKINDYARKTLKLFALVYPSMWW